MEYVTPNVSQMPGSTDLATRESVCQKAAISGRSVSFASAPTTLSKATASNPARKHQVGRKAEPPSPVRCLSFILLSEHGSRPCEATTTAAKAESARGRRRQARHGCVWDCESSAGLHSRRGDRSRVCGSHFVKSRAG